MRFLAALGLTVFVSCLSGPVWAQDPIELRYEDVVGPQGWKSGTKVYLTSNLDFAVCVHPYTGELHNLSGDFDSEVIRLEAGEKDKLIGKFMADALYEEWRISIGWDTDLDCL